MNNELDLFTAALNLTNPWRVVRTNFQPSDRRLDLYLDFDRGARFECPTCGAKCPVHDTVEKEWRHLNFFQYQAYLHARLPRISCEKDGVLQIDPPCARAGSGFTLLFEAFVLTLAKDMPVLAIAGQQARTALGGHYQQEVDLAALFKDVAGAFVHTATLPAQVRHLTDRAVRIALAGRQVTALIFPNDLQDLKYEEPPRAHGTLHSGIGYQAPKTIPYERELRQAADVR